MKISERVKPNLEHNQSCPLCRSGDTDFFHEDRLRVYIRCNRCRLVFVPEVFHLDEAEEKSQYDLHDNDSTDPGYRRFLSRLVDPMCEKLSRGSHGLDFGCGPDSAIKTLFKERGHSISCFDRFYHNTPQVFESEYDFICATEVVEHLRNPQKEFSRLFKVLRPGGWLGVMTKKVLNQHAFKTWHYIRDETHIRFYCRDTFLYIARTFKARVFFTGKDVILLQAG